MEPQTRVSLKQLADYLGLSQTTVSVVVNGAPAAQAIPDATRKRVLVAARKLNYRASYLARSLSMKRSMSVGILAPELSEGYFTLVMNGLEESLQKEDYYSILAFHNWNRGLKTGAPEMLINRAVDGLIFLNTLARTPVEVPAVAISGQQKVAGLTNVLLDHKAAAVLTVDHLRSLGHRRIALMKGPSFTLDTAARWTNTIQVARQAGITIEPELHIGVECNSLSPHLGYLPVRNLLSRTRNFTAMICFNDTAALGAVRALHESGIRVPQDVSVVGFDDIMSAEFYTPSLTTVRQPLRKMGQVAAEVLLEKIHHPNVRQPKQIMMQPELIVRESTCRAAGRR